MRPPRAGHEGRGRPLNLTDDLQSAIADEVAALAVEHRELAAAATRLSRRYREGGPATGLDGSPAAIAAYLVTRLPATWAATVAALSAVADARPAWHPRTLLDVGGGPGTVLWATTSVWGSLERAAVVEQDPRMLAVGRRMAQRAQPPAVRGARWLASDVTRGDWQQPADLVVAAYVLGELPPAARARFIERLVTMATVAVVVEPGTPEGSARVLAAREVALAAGGRTVAPCPHDEACPLARPDWCHFAARVNRTKLHRQIKGAQAPYEDEKFSYGAWTREPVDRPGPARVLRHPRIDPGRITLSLCTMDGTALETVTARDRLPFKAARKVSWGQTWPPA